MFTKILVAVSARSADTVLASAIEAARKYDTQIVALHVIDPRPCYLRGVDCNYGLIVDAMKAHGRKVITHIRNVLANQVRPADVRMLTLPTSGMTMGRAIAGMADETGADLILLGQRGTFRWRWLDEDVAMEVMRCSSKPVQIAAASPASKAGRVMCAPRDLHV
jgi:nucleotide-binding universal stress UspA family protein